MILFAFVIMASASGAYVNLAQATLIDRDLTRSAPTMARWTILGSIGVTASPLIATAVFYLGYGWRGLYLSLVAVAGLYAMILIRHRFNGDHVSGEESVSPKILFQNLITGLTNRELIRWMLLTELADLMLDKLLEVTGLYFHDVAGVSLAAASAAVAVSTIRVDRRRGVSACAGASQRSARFAVQRGDRFRRLRFFLVDSERADQIYFDRRRRFQHGGVVSGVEGEVLRRPARSIGVGDGGDIARQRLKFVCAGYPRRTCRRLWVWVGRCGCWRWDRWRCSLGLGRETSPPTPSPELKNTIRERGE